MNQHACKTRDIKYNITPFHNVLQTSNGNEVHDEICYQKTGNFVAQRANNYVYEQLVHEDKDTDHDMT